jgi:hypothetical protein
MVNVTEYTVKQIILSSWQSPADLDRQAQTTSPHPPQPQRQIDLLYPLRQWLNHLEVKNEHLAHHLCFLIPSQCPFERDIKLFGRTLFHIPPLCKLNPLYEELVMLRFKALCYLADECVDNSPP